MRNKHLFLLIFLPLIFFALAAPPPAYAQTEFVSTVAESGGDYSTLALWEAAIQCDLTAATTKVFSHGGITGTIDDGAAVTGATSSATATEIHATSTQILLSGISGTFQSGEQVQVDGSNYVTISDAGDSAIAVARITNSWSSADTTAVTIDGWTASATNYIKIYTSGSARHNGVWSDTAYRIVLTDTMAINVYESYVTIDGLQISILGTANTQYGINLGSGVLYNVNISNNIMKDAGLATSRCGIGYSSATVDRQNIKAWNNIMYGFNKGMYFGSNNAGSGIFYNNTFYGVDSGISNGNAGVIIAKNNIVQNVTDGFTGTFDDASDYNVSDVADDTTGGANDQHTTTVTFRDPDNDDFRLSGADTSAYNAGTDLSADTNLAFSTDIQGEARPAGAWDIGADERISSGAVVYYSVGTSTSDLKTETPTVTIASGTATFSTAQANNIGIGDKVTYNTNVVAYISGRTSSTVYSVITAIGGTPANITDSTVVSIKRTFNSLSAAEAGAVGASYLNTTDLVAGNYQLNFPCYADGTDTTAVVINGYTTGANNYIRIYTPTATSEVGTSQRHNGKWDAATAYTLGEIVADAIQVDEAYVRIEGLQVEVNTAEDPDYNKCIVVFDLGDDDDHSASDVHIGYNICTEGASIHNPSMTYGFTVGNEFNATFYNNIVYGIDGLGYTNCPAFMIATTASGTVNFYNNTVYDSDDGFHTSSNSGATEVLKNNITQNCTNGFDGTFDAASDYNISDLASDAPGSNSLNETTVTFADAANNDFRLAANDTAAVDAGIDLSSDVNLAFTDDIKGTTRVSGAWDIGADEAARAIYYSVGIITSDFNTGSATVAVTGGNTATFSAALSDNIGVGDKLTYSDNTAYIYQRNSSTVFLVQSATGGLAINAADGAVTIKRAFNSLSAAEAGVIGSSYLKTTDLVAGNYQLNFPCYADGADTTAVVVDGYTTGAVNYIKIYTPTASTEVGTSQRHNGVWDADKYRLEAAGTVLTISESYVRIDGVQVYMSSDAGVQYGMHINAADASSDIQVSDNIIKGTGSFTSNENRGIYGISSAKIWNNIIYDFDTSGTDNAGMSLTNADYSYYIYNNTIDNCQNGILQSSATVIAKNNIVNGSGDTNAYVGTFAEGTDYNATDGTDSIGQGSNNKISQTFTFSDFANDDFRLAITDTAAVDAGTDLSADSFFAFSTDINAQTRPLGDSWDIGADETGDDLSSAVAPTVTHASLVAGATSNTSIAFTTVNAISVNGDVQVTFPSGFDISSAAYVSGNASSTVSVSSQVLTINLGTAVAADEAVSIVISGIKNPTVTGSGGTYAIETQSELDAGIDTGIAAAQTFTVGALTSVSVTPA
ncbi:hypothetical protein KAR91_84690, partial [Candidatus Pacearchaeota archaeon]|nr:hypothetical protein [Candidatus Pacearchaeota archaeon]